MHFCIKKAVEYKVKTSEADYWGEFIVSAIIRKYLEQLREKNGRIELSILPPHSIGSGEKVVIECIKDANTTIKVMPLPATRRGGVKMWDFIEKFLPNYYHRDDVLHFDIYTRYIDNEELSEEDEEWIYADFGSDKEKVKQTIEQMEKDFVYEALRNWLESHSPEDW